MAKRDGLSMEHPEALTDALRALEVGAAESTLRQAAVAGARVIQEEVKLRAPVGDKTYERKGSEHKPGVLRDSILVAYDEPDSLQGVRATYLVTWSKDAFYGRFIEFGTSKMAARPFLRPAYEAKKEAAAKAVADVIAAKIQQAKT